MKQCSGACGHAISSTDYQADVHEAVETLTQYGELDSKASIDHFLKTRALKNPILRRYREFLVDTRDQISLLPEMFQKKFLIVEKDRDIGYLICDGRLRRVYRGDELGDMESIREYAMAQELSREAGRETLDEQLTVRRYVSMNRHRLNMIGLE